MKHAGAPLGQHFLTASWAARALARAAAITPDDMVLEIGPGNGFLTRELLARGAHVIAVERDAALVEKLESAFADEIASGALEVHTADIRSVPPHALGLTAGAYVLAANIPYYITGEILRTFLAAPAHPRTAALLVQKEVAERIATSTKESILSISVRVFGTPRKAAVVPRRAFSPPPAVDSAILAIGRISRTKLTGIDEHHFFHIVKSGFATKRKLLASNLARHWDRTDVEHAYAACGMSSNVRAEDVSLDVWLCLARSLPPLKHSSMEPQ